MRRLGLGVGLGRGSLRFSPSSLYAGGVQGVWFDPSDFSTMFQDSAGTTPVTAVGQPVGKILDKSGNGNHATQATSANRPVLQQDGNGKYYLAFNGTNSTLSTANINFSASDKLTAYLGLRKGASGTAIIAELSAVSNSNPGSFYIGSDAANSNDYTTELSGSSSQYISSQTYTAPVTNVLSVVYDKAGALVTDEIKPRINAALPPTMTNSSNPAGSGAFGTYPLYIGARGGASLYFTGNLYSLILVGAANSASDVSNTETWVNSKTGAY